MTTTAETLAPGTPKDYANPLEYAAWLVDLDGTLYRQHAVRCAMACQLLLRGRSVIKILKAFREEHERLRGFQLQGEADPFLLQIERASRRLALSQQEVTAAVDDWMFQRPGRWLRLFRRRRLLVSISLYRRHGGKTAVVSDYPACAKLTAMGLAEYFDQVVACGEPGGPNGLKPLPTGLLLAAERLQVRPAECLVIGDRWDADGEAARRAGMAFRHVARMRYQTLS
jgi:beta-phosphoglucomutase-like phosphatase (HAD superfamily)